jgi:putative SOS response-associated peptidase YedK
VPATNYFEWATDPERPKGKKLMWKFTVVDQETFAFPGIWDHAETVDGPIDSRRFSPILEIRKSGGHSLVRCGLEGIA